MQQQDLNLFETGLDETAKAHLLETTRWTKFLAICYVIFLFFILAYLIFMVVYFGSIMGGNEELGSIFGAVIGAFAIIGIGFNVYPIYALFKFSSCMKKGIQSNNREMINDGFRYQKTMYRYLGILTIISLILTLLSFILGGVGSITG